MPLAELIDLPSSTTGVADTIISLAVVSSTGESARTVFTALQKSAPRLLIQFNHHRFYGSEELAGASGQGCGFRARDALGVDAANQLNPALGKPDAFLFLNKDDLGSPERRALATRIIRRHFC